MLVHQRLRILIKGRDEFQVFNERKQRCQPAHPTSQPGKQTVKLNCKHEINQLQLSVSSSLSSATTTATTTTTITTAATTTATTSTRKQQEEDCYFINKRPLTGRSSLEIFSTKG